MHTATSHTTDYCIDTSDIFSYYKEAQGGETGTYVLNYAAINQVSEAEALGRIIDYTISLIHRVRGILGEGKARDAWESFASGYIRYHLQTERYKLVEILPDLLT